MKKEYTNPTIEIIEINNEDVIIMSQEFGSKDIAGYINNEW